MKILIADDSTTIRNLIVEILRDAGFHNLLQARDGLEAIASISVGNIDLALLDWHMPRLSGFEVLSTLRADGCKVPIILVTGDSAPDKIQAAVRAGVDEYVAKPFKPEFLVEKVLKAAAPKSGESFS